MAVVKVAKASRLSIQVQTGLNAAGNPVYRVRTYRNVKPGALEADVFAVGQAIGGLQKYAVNAISRIDEGDLMNQ